jgi:hypothetical protein
MVRRKIVLKGLRMILRINAHRQVGRPGSLHRQHRQVYALFNLEVANFVKAKS